MDWLAPIDIYCERLSAEFWAEPLNALSNTFILCAGFAGFWLNQKLPKAHKSLWLVWLSAWASIVAVGSFIFHTFAQKWAMWADIIPIMIFMLSFFAFALARILRLGTLTVSLLLMAFATIGFILQISVPREILNGSLSYAHGVLSLLAIGIILKKNAHPTANLFLQASLAFLVSLSFRTFDMELCEYFPWGTHFLWHSFNGLLIYLVLRIAYVQLQNKEPEVTSP